MLRDLSIALGRKARIQTKLRQPCRRLSFAAYIAVLVPLAAHGQVLHLALARPANPGEVVVDISLQSPSGKAPAALQWETTVEGAGLTVTQDAAPRKPNTPAGKSIRCAAKSTASKTQTFFCLLAGGVDPIPNGNVALIRLGLLRGKQTAPVRIRVGNVIGVGKDLQRTSIRAAELVLPLAR